MFANGSNSLFKQKYESQATKDERESNERKSCVRVEKFIFDFFIACGPSSRVNYIAFWTGTILMTLQIFNFLSDSYMFTNEFKTGFTNVLFFVTRHASEFNLSNPINDYYISCCIQSCFFLLCFSAYITRQFFNRMSLFHIISPLLPWSNYLFFPQSVPHMKMTLACIDKSAHARHPFYAGVNCWDGAYGAYFAASCFFFFFITMITVSTIQLHFNSAIPNQLQTVDTVYDSRRDSQAELFFFLAKYQLLITFILNHSQESIVYIACVAFVLGCGASIQYIRTLPWWNDTMQTQYLWQSMLLTWLSGCLIVNHALNDIESATTLFIVGIPLTLIAAALGIKHRLQNIAYFTKDSVGSSINGILLVRHMINAFYRKVQGDGSVYVEFVDVKEEFDELILKLDRIITSLGQRFPNDASIYLLASQYYIHIKQSRIFAYQALGQMHKCDQGIQERFHYYTLFNKLSVAAHNAQADDLKAYLEVRDKVAHQKVVVSAATAKLVTFWGILLQEKRPDLDQLVTLAEITRHLVENCVYTFDRILKLNPENTGVLYLYGTFQQDICGDVGKATEQFAQALSVATIEKGSFKECTYSDDRREIPVHLSVFDESNGIVTVMNSESESGKVISANNAFMRIFGLFSAQSIIGCNITKCIPAPISTSHNDYLSLYFHRRKSHVVGHTLLTLALHQSGFIFPIALHIRWSEEALGHMLALVRPLRIPHEACGFVDVQTLNVFHATESFASLFGYGKSELLAGTLNFLDIFPEAAPGIRDEGKLINGEIMQRLGSLEGYKATLAHIVTGQQLRVAVWMREQEAIHRNYYMQRLLFIGGVHEGPSADEPITGVDLIPGVTEAQRIQAVNGKLNPFEMDEEDDEEGQELLSTRELRKSLTRNYAENHKSGLADASSRVVVSNTDINSASTVSKEDPTKATTYLESLKKGQYSRTRAHKMKLRRSIHISSKENSARMSRFSTCVLAIFTLCALLMLVHWIVLFVHLEIVKDSEWSLYRASTRQIKGSLVTFQLLAFKIIHQYALTSDPSSLSVLFYLPLHHKSADIYDVKDEYHADIKANLAAFQGDTLAADFGKMSNKRRDFLVQNSVYAYERQISNVETPWRHSMIPYRDYIDKFIGSTHVGLLNLFPDKNRDLGYSYLIANLVTKQYEVAMNTFMSLQLEETLDIMDIIVQLTYIFAGVGFGVVLLGWIFFLFPIQMQVESERNEILDVFLMIPISIRKKLRSRALGLYKLVNVEEAQDEEGHKQNVSKKKHDAGKTIQMGNNSVVGGSVVDMPEQKLASEKEAAKSKKVLKQLSSSVAKRAVWRYSFFVFFFQAYFGANIYLLQKFKGDIDQGLQVMIESSTRTNDILQSFTFVSLHILFPQSIDPEDPVTLASRPLREMALESLGKSVKAFNNVLYGNRELNIRRPVLTEQQRYIMYENMCPPEESFDLMIRSFTNKERDYTYLLPQACNAAFAGVFDQGLMNLIYMMEENIIQAVVPEAHGILYYSLVNYGVPFEFAYITDPQVMMQIIQAYTLFYAGYAFMVQFFFQYFLPIVELSSYFYHVKVLEICTEYVTLMIIIVSILVLIIFISYFVLIRPLMTRITHMSKETHSMMLLLPLQVASTSNVQNFINKHLDLH